jgi:mRNA interferase MazF
MKRGEVWVLRDDEYASKARPVIVVQSDETNGLKKDSYVMTEKLITI